MAKMKQKGMGECVFLRTKNIFRPLEVNNVAIKHIISPQSFMTINHFTPLLLQGIAKRRYKMVDGSLRRFTYNKINSHHEYRIFRSCKTFLMRFFNVRLDWYLYLPSVGHICLTMLISCIFFVLSSSENPVRMLKKRRELQHSTETIPSIKSNPCSMDDSHAPNRCSIYSKSHILISLLTASFSFVFCHWHNDLE